MRQGRGRQQREQDQSCRPESEVLHLSSLECSTEKSISSAKRRRARAAWPCAGPVTTAGMATLRVARVLLHPYKVPLSARMVVRAARMLDTAQSRTQHARTALERPPTALSSAIFVRHGARR